MSIAVALRLSKNWTIEDVARELEMSPDEYSKIEAGEKLMTIHNAVKLAELFSIPPELFFATGNSKIINNNVGTYSKGVVNAVTFHESKELGDKSE